MTNIRLSRETDIRTWKMLCLSKDAHAQNKSNFHWDLTIRQSRWPLHLSPSNNDSNQCKIREKHDRLLDLGSSTGQRGDMTLSENNVELLKEVAPKPHIWFSPVHYGKWAETPRPDFCMVSYMYKVFSTVLTPLLCKSSHHASLKSSWFLMSCLFFFYKWKPRQHVSKCLKIRLVSHKYRLSTINHQDSAVK